MTPADVRAALTYDAGSGVFCRIGGPRAGLPAGGISRRDGYARIAIAGRLFMAHRLAWLFTHGRWPAQDIDHINGDRSDNRIDNLREASRQENLRNKRPRNKTGLKGVIVHKDERRAKRYGAQIHPGKYVWLGWYATPEEAHAAYCTAAHALYGEFARVT